MRVDLGPLPYQHAQELIKWCVEHNVDRTQAIRLLEQWCSKEKIIEDWEWYLDIPEQHITYFLLKWA